MRRALLAILTLALAACPAAQDHPGDDDTGIDGGITDASAPDAFQACTTAQPTCQVTIHYTGSGSSVELHGDFAPDGWAVGVPMTQVGGEWQVTLDVDDEQVILYKFVVDGVWMADPDNPNGSPDGFGGMNSVLKVDCDHCPSRPAIDWRDAVLYFVMIDRFANGDSGNDSPLGLEPPADYEGGDLVGLRQKIEEGYFEDLGVNALWITSPLDNADGAGVGADGHNYSGYHGYWPKDLDSVESRIGTEAQLEDVVRVAHEHGLQVILDYVMNHVHEESPVYQSHQDWFWPNDNGAGGNCVCGSGCSWDDSYQRKRCWFTSYLPDFNFTNGDARNYSVSNAIMWAKKIGADGYRLDAVKHIEDSWLTDLRARLNAEVQGDQVFYLVGETYTGDRDLIKYYVNPSTMLDGQFDFPLRAQILEKILRRAGNLGDLVSFLDSNADFYGPGAVMSTFIGNHDVPRVIHIAEDTPLFGDWDDGKGRAWSNQPQLPTSRHPFERVAVAYTLLMTTPGVPLIYYGDEIGLPGAGDPDNRRMMEWSGLTADQTWLRERMTALIHARKQHVALRRGTRQTLGVTADVYTYAMSGGGETLYVVLNRGDGASAAQGLPSGNYRDLLTGDTLTAPVQAPARTGLVLQPM
ncbi:MAG: hypothetical protein H6708_14905 [Kofleriaceae bacterium]|nr:hypothetical protein [Myxococcales bacterium]MCB9561691.1 hypothetical protein [Kofleriaceae bacterium]